MDNSRARALQEKIAREAIAMISIGGTAELHERAVRLIGDAWLLPADDTIALEEKIQSEKEVIRRMAAGEPAQHVITDEDLLANWSGREIEVTIEELFETTTHLDDYNDRAMMFQLTMELIETQNYLDWIEKVPGEDELLELTPT